MQINIKRIIWSDYLPALVTGALCILKPPQTLAADMDTIRSLNRLRWWVVAWLTLSLGAALASPLVQPRTVELICSSSGGAALVLHLASGDAVPDTQDQDCAWCLLGAAPPQPPAALLPRLAVTDFAPPEPPDRHCLPPMAAPPPARAPPVFFIYHT